MYMNPISLIVTHDSLMVSDLTPQTKISPSTQPQMLWSDHNLQSSIFNTEPDFKEQTNVMYVLEVSKKLLGVEPESFVQPAVPRIFLSHLPYSQIPKGGKSSTFLGIKYFFYRMFDYLAALKGRVSLPILFQAVVKSGYIAIEETIKDLLIWWEHRHNDDI